MSLRTLGWIVLAVGAALLLVSPVFDHPWEQFTDAVTAGAVMVVGPRTRDLREAITR